MRILLLAFLLLSACKPLPIEQRAWNACVRAVDTAVGLRDPQAYNPAGVHLDDTYKDGTPVDFSTYTGLRQYEVSVFYAASKSMYHCVLMYDPAEDMWKITELTVK